jgi:hypothetical protein
MNEVLPMGSLWLWLTIAFFFLGLIVYLVKRIGPGGPWLR